MRLVLSVPWWIAILLWLIVASVMLFVMLLLASVWLGVKAVELTVSGVRRARRLRHA